MENKSKVTHRILLLAGNGNLFKFDNTENYFVDVDDVYKNFKGKMKIIALSIRKFMFMFNTDIIVAWLGEWINKVDNYDTVIIFDSNLKIAIVKYLNKHYPKVRVIVYYRNSVRDLGRLQPEKLRKYNCELWSYNINDCTEYSFKYNRQVWNPKVLKGLLKKKEKVLYDVIFIGADKNRVDTLISLYSIFHNKGLRTYFYLISNKIISFDENKDNKYMPYDSYLELVNKSNAILDLVSQNNYGLTLRPLEALFLNKKLITNYKQIRDYDFYNKNNIFILDYDNYGDLDDFIKTPYVEIDSTIVNKYDLNNWVERFFEL